MRTDRCATGEPAPHRFGKTLDFDEDERPVRIQVTDVFERHETVVTYPSPTEAIQTTTGFTVGRGGGR